MERTTSLFLQSKTNSILNEDQQLKNYQSIESKQSIWMNFSLIEL